MKRDAKEESCTQDKLCSWHLQIITFVYLETHGTITIKVKHITLESSAVPLVIFPISSLSAYPFPSLVNNSHSHLSRVTLMGPEDYIPPCPTPLTMPFMLKFNHRVACGSTCSFKFLGHTLWCGYSMAWFPFNECLGCFQHEVITYNHPALCDVQMPLGENSAVSFRWLSRCSMAKADHRCVFTILRNFRAIFWWLCFYISTSHVGRSGCCTRLPVDMLCCLAIPVGVWW